MKKAAKILVIWISLLAPMAMPSVARAAGADLQAALREVTKALQNGSADVISGYLGKMVDLDLPGFQGTYSRSQAGKIISDFFADHKVKEFKVNRQDKTGDGGYYVVGHLVSGSTTYRVYLVVKEEGGSAVVPVFRINEQ